MSSTEEVRSIYQHETNGISLPLLSFFPQYFVVTPILFDDLWIWVKTLYTAHIHTAAYSLRCWCCLFYWVIKNGRTSHQGDESTFYSLLRVDIKFLVLKQHNLFRGKCKFLTWWWLLVFCQIISMRWRFCHPSIASTPSRGTPSHITERIKNCQCCLEGETHTKNQ